VRKQSPAAPGAARAGATAHGTPAFEALLEKLERRAAELRAQADAVEEPEQLASAVEDARTSLEDALSLGASLLEAYRQAQQQRGGE
jgi:hypothetical protein